MGTINNTLANSYLSSLFSSGSGGSAASSQATGVQALLQALDGAATGSSGNSPGSYLLDLSPEAQQLMGSSSASGSSSNFVLTGEQQTAIENIVAQYKNEPFDQATLNAIEAALQSAGLSPQALAAQDQIRSFDPTNVLLSDLSGNYSNIQTPGASAATEQTKEGNYLQSIIKLWKEDSAATSSGSGSSSSGSAAA